MGLVIAVGEGQLVSAITARQGMPKSQKVSGVTMFTNTQKCRRGMLGWLAVSTALSLIFSSQALLALDLDREISKQNADSAQILSTLGRSKRPNAKTSKDTNRKVMVKLIPSKKARKRG
jgi:hypothetical protein